jgi:hypothetical protein
MPTLYRRFRLSHIDKSFTLEKLVESQYNMRKFPACLTSIADAIKLHFEGGDSG